MYSERAFFLTIVRQAVQLHVRMWLCVCSVLRGRSRRRRAFNLMVSDGGVFKRALDILLMMWIFNYIR